LKTIKRKQRKQDRIIRALASFQKSILDKVLQVKNIADRYITSNGNYYFSLNVKSVYLQVDFTFCKNPEWNEVDEERERGV